MTLRVDGEAQFLTHAVQSVQQVATAKSLCQFGTESYLWNGNARHQDGNKNCRHHESEDQYAVLRYLSVCNPLHSSENSVEENDCHADDDACGDVDLKKP